MPPRRTSVDCARLYTRDMTRGWLARWPAHRAAAQLAALASLAVLLTTGASGPSGHLVALAAFAVVGVLALRQCARLLPASGALRPGIVATLRRRRAEHQAPLRLHDPDAPGHPRPRAPGAGPAA